MPGLKYDRAFMIGWYVDYGYDSVNTNPSNLSDIIFTDYNRPFTIGTIYNSGIFKESTSFDRNGNPNNYDDLTNDEWHSKIANVIGEDYYTIYCIPAYFYSLDIPEAAVPSVYLAFPNLRELLGKQPISHYFVYFKSIKKLVRYSNSSPTTFSIYSVSENGSLTNLANPSDRSTQLFNACGQRFGFMVIPNYSRETDLSDFNNYIFINRTINNASKATSVCSVLPSALSSGARNAIELLFSDSVPDFDNISPPNPFDPIGPSGPDIPGGKFDDQSDIIGDSSIPSLSASDTGFTRIYIPTLSQVQDLARYLWTDETVVETIWNKIKQFFENPMEAIIGFNLVPVPVPSSGTKSFALMYIDTGVDMDTAASQFVDVDCGTFKLEYYYGSALDYSPYTKVSCFLPYIGMVQLNTDEVMNRTLQIKYRVDIVSGSCVAKILVDGNCIYQYSGHCAITIPISASDFTSYVSAAISVAKLAVGAAVGGAAGAVSAALQADVAQQTGGAQTLIPTPPPSAGAIVPASIGGALGPSIPQQEQPSSAGSTSASFAGITPKNISNTVGEIMGSKPHVQHSGSFSGNSGYLGVRRPFLIIERPNLCLPENYQQLNGFPAMITMLLGECSGYTRVQQVELTGLPATNPEQAEILELLKSGVIF